MQFNFNGLITIAFMIIFFTLSSIAKIYEWNNLSQQQYIDNLIECQIQIKNFNWDNTLWPESNINPKPKFKDVLDRLKVRKKV
jgi:hypothetical protein